MKLNKRAEEKKQEVFEIAKNTIAPHFSNPEKLSTKIIDHFCRITPPEIDDTPITKIDTTLHIFLNIQPGGLGGARSSKPGNILLNWRKLLIDASESILTIVGAVTVPWLIPLAGLVVWNKVWSLSSIEIDERHAAVIWTMWKNRDEENCIKNDKVLGLVNNELSKYNRPMMNEKELKDILKDLEEMECVESMEEDKWWLREWVKTTYE